jgi:hypothetical protein
MNKKDYEALLKETLAVWDRHIALSDSNREEEEKRERRREFEKAFRDLIKKSCPE